MCNLLRANNFETYNLYNTKLLIKMKIVLFAIIALSLFTSSCNSATLNSKINSQTSITGINTFEKAFQEVAYAYYMRGSYLHYNVSKGDGHILSPEASTRQNYIYMACSLYVMNVYKELLGIELSGSGDAYSRYAQKYLGKRKEVIGYGRLQENGDLYWYDGSKNDKGDLYIIVNPSKYYILSQLKIGDVLEYSGHVMLIYDLIYDGNGNVVDAYLINSNTSNGNKVKTKNHGLSARIFDLERKKVSLRVGHAPWAGLYYNESDRRGKYPDSMIEGTVTLETFSERANRNGVLLFDKSNPKNKYKKYYSILRFVDYNKKDNKEMLNFDGTYREFQGETLNNQEVRYSESVKSRLKFSKLFIEKIVDKRDGNVVGHDDELIYSITIRNNSKKDYMEDIEVKEFLSEHVAYKKWNVKTKLKNNTYSKSVSFTKDGRILKWNIGKLSSGDEVVIEYTVKIKGNCDGEIIESRGTVANIPSGVVKNKVGKGLTKKKKEKIKYSYEILKNKFHGKQLIDEIYKESCNVELGLRNFNLRADSKNDDAGLIYYNNQWGSRNRNDGSYMSLSQNYPYSKMVLNSYFNALYEHPTQWITYNGILVKIYALPSLDFEENDPDQRANTIWPTDFKTGDILIYTNTNDKTYSLIKGTYDTKENYVTYEDGEYCYIFIEGRGFVGVNWGKDGIKGTRDDRNEFNVNYYKDNGLSLCTKIGNPAAMTDYLEEWLHYQTLFGKDYYVVLRPSLSQ